MIGLDTNVLLRLIVADDRAQANIAQFFLEEHCSEATPGYVNSVVLVEIIWVLERSYKYTKSEIVKAIEAILQVRELTVQNASEVWEALQLYQQGGAGFADHYIGVLNKHKKCSFTVTFDKKASKTENYKLLEQ